MDLDSLISSDNYGDLDSIVVSFNDATGALKSENGKQIDFGKTINFRLPALKDQSEEETTDALGYMWLTLIWMALSISFILAVFQGSLVHTWIFINSLQMISHVPLISTSLPSNAHYFLLNMLGLARFKFDSFNSMVYGQDSSFKEQDLIDDPSSVFNYQIYNS